MRVLDGLFEGKLEIDGYADRFNNFERLSTDNARSELQLEVDLRVLSENGKFVVVDASVEGIWLALTQREELTSFLDQHNGDFKALDARLDQLSAQLLETGPSTAKN